VEVVGRQERGTRMAHRRSARFAPPDFLLRLVALANFMRLSLTKGAHATLSSAAWQEIRVGMTKRRGSLQGKGGC
jgi:hypothetical protein